MTSANERELAYYEDLYGGFAQQHFAKSAVRAFRRYLTQRILKVTNAGRNWRVLSVGCGIGDTELQIAPHVGEIVGVDLSPKAITQARTDADRAGARNVSFTAGDWRTETASMGRFDLILGVFFLHHLSDRELAAAPRRFAKSLRPGGQIYALEPSARRLAGMVGKLVVPRLMRRYQTADERQLEAQATAEFFRKSGYAAQANWFDFVSTPLAGLIPSWESGYQFARFIDGALIRTPVVRRWSANFELTAVRQ